MKKLIISFILIIAPLLTMAQTNVSGNVVVLFQTKCREADRVRVERQLRRELVLVMEREGMTAI